MHAVMEQPRAPPPRLKTSSINSNPRKIRTALGDAGGATQFAIAMREHNDILCSMLGNVTEMWFSQALKRGDRLVA
jgi:hypothetical protein